MISKRWVKRVVIGGLAAVGLAAGLFAGWRWWVRDDYARDYRAAVAEAEQTDPAWRWEALNAARPVPPPGRNAADLIPQIHRLTPPTYFNKLDGEWAEYDWPPPVNARYPEPVIAEARQQLAAAAPAVALARTLKDYPTGRREVVLTPAVIDSCPTETTNATRTPAALLKWDVVLAVEDGDTARVADSLLAGLNVSRSIGDEPTFLSQIVRNSVRAVPTRSLEWALAQVELPEARLAAVQAAWAADAEEPLLLYALRGERALMDRLFEHLADGTIDIRAYMGDPSKTGPDRLEQDFDLWQYRNRIAKDRAFSLRWFTGAVAAARLPAEQQSAAFASLPALPQRDPDVRLSGLHPAMASNTIPSFWRGVAETRCAVVAVACERFRLRHGRWPNDLAELPRDILTAVPLDPFNGKPLRYQRLPDGVAVYSVGKDLKDDGGNLARTGNESGTDFGFRLWAPAHRRRPPPPPRPNAPPPDQPAPEDKP